MVLARDSDATADRPAELRGDMQLDDDGTLRGWCWLPARPSERLAIEILFDAAVATRLVAAEYRRDLNDSGIGDGRHGFSHRLPLGLLHQPDAPGMATARLAGNRQVFGRVLLPEAGRPAPYDAALEQAAMRLDDLAATLAAVPVHRAAPGARLRAAFGATGAALAGDPLAAARRALLRHGPAPVLHAGSPRATLVRLADDAAAAWRWLGGMAPLTAEGVELLLLDPGHDARVALLPALVPGLAFRRAKGAAGLDGLLAAAGVARGVAMLSSGDGSAAAIATLLARPEAAGVVVPRATAAALGLDLPGVTIAAPTGLALLAPAALLAAGPLPLVIEAARARNLALHALDEPWALL